MTSLPSPDTDYEAPVDMEISKAAWDAALVSIGARLRAVEALGSDMQAVIDAGEAAGQQAIADALEPLMTQYLEQLNGFIGDLNAADNQLAAIVAGGLEANGVIIEPALAALPGSSNLRQALTALAQSLTSIDTRVEDLEGITVYDGGEF